MQRIAISGLAALAAVLGGAAVPTVAMAQPMSAEHPVDRSAWAAAWSGQRGWVRTAEAAGMAEASRITTAVGRAGLAWRADLAAAADDTASAGEPLDSCALTVNCLAVEGSSDLVASTSGNSVSAATAAAPLVHAARWNGSSWKGVGVDAARGDQGRRPARRVLPGGERLPGGRGLLHVHERHGGIARAGADLQRDLAEADPGGAAAQGTTDASLSGVSCVTTSYCVAIGEADGNTAAFGENGELTLIETWNGAKWTLHTAAESSGTTVADPPRSPAPRPRSASWPGRRSPSAAAQLPHLSFAVLR